MELNLIRKSDNGTQTLGSLILKNEQGVIVFSCDTLELPWKDNKKKISCIPKNTYDCIKRESTNNIPYLHVLIMNIPNRDGVCIHKGNLYTQIQGCVLVGKGYGDINKDGQLDVLSSGVTFDKMMALLPDKFKLKIE